MSYHVPCGPSFVHVRTELQDLGFAPHALNSAGMYESQRRNQVSESALAAQSQSDFVLHNLRANIAYDRLLPHAIVNHVPQILTTARKLTLTKYMKTEALGEGFDGNAVYPEAYDLSDSHQVNAFSRHFHQLECMRIIKQFVNDLHTAGVQPLSVRPDHCATCVSSYGLAPPISFSGLPSQAKAIVIALQMLHHRIGECLHAIDPTLPHMSLLELTRVHPSPSPLISTSPPARTAPPTRTSTRSETPVGDISPSSDTRMPPSCYSTSALWWAHATSLLHALHAVDMHAHTHARSHADVDIQADINPHVGVHSRAPYAHPEAPRVLPHRYREVLVHTYMALPPSTYLTHAYTTIGSAPVATADASTNGTSDYVPASDGCTHAHCMPAAAAPLSASLASLALGPNQPHDTTVTGSIPRSHSGTTPDSDTAGADGLDDVTASDQHANALLHALATALLRAWRVCDPCAAMGEDNVWIAKPGALSRGRGIHLLRSLAAAQSLAHHPIALGRITPLPPGPLASTKAAAPYTQASPPPAGGALVRTQPADTRTSMLVSSHTSTPAPTAIPTPSSTSLSFSPSRQPSSHAGPPNLPARSRVGVGVRARGAKEATAGRDADACGGVVHEEGCAGACGCLVHEWPCPASVAQETPAMEAQPPDATTSCIVDKMAATCRIDPAVTTVAAVAVDMDTGVVTGTTVDNGHNRDRQQHHEQIGVNTTHVQAADATRLDPRGHAAAEACQLLPAPAVIGASTGSAGHELVTEDVRDKQLRQVAQRRARDASAMSKAGVDRMWLVQRYLARPLLLRGHKFDLRQWLLITIEHPLVHTHHTTTRTSPPSTALSLTSTTASPPATHASLPYTSDTSNVRLSCWLFDAPYARITSAPFSLAVDTAAAHITNNSVQKHEQAFGALAWARGNMLGARAVAEMLQREGGNADTSAGAGDASVGDQAGGMNGGENACGDGLDVYTRVLLPALVERSRLLFASFLRDYSEHTPRPRSYELLGVDWACDASGLPWLLEVNLSPTFADIHVPGLVRRLSKDLVRITARTLLMDRQHGTHKDTQKNRHKGACNDTHEDAQPAAPCPVVGDSPHAPVEVDADTSVAAAQSTSPVSMSTRAPVPTPNYAHAHAHVRAVLEGTHAELTTSAWFADNDASCPALAVADGENCSSGGLRADAGAITVSSGSNAGSRAATTPPHRAATASPTTTTTGASIAASPGTGTGHSPLQQLLQSFPRAPPQWGTTGDRVGSMHCLAHVDVPVTMLRGARAHALSIQGVRMGNGPAREEGMDVNICGGVGGE